MSKDNIRVIVVEEEDAVVSKEGLKKGIGQTGQW